MNDIDLSKLSGAEREIMEKDLDYCNFDVIKTLGYFAQKTR